MSKKTISGENMLAGTVTMQASKMNFDPAVFPHYGKLSRSERIFLKTCCYYPPRPRRERAPEQIEETAHYAAIYEKAFGRQLWSLISNKEVLDLGCGEGGFVLALAENGPSQVMGLDIQPDFKYAAEESTRRGLSHVSFVGKRAETLEEETFDVVISHDSFEHFADPAHMLNEMVRLTRPGGHILIKFGPPWRSPWGRHMGGTVRRDRPWIHLLVSEHTIMRCHSVYHNITPLAESYGDLSGGLNKMTVGRFRTLLQDQPGLQVQEFTQFPLYGLPALAAIPGVGELFVTGVRAVCERQD